MTSSPPASESEGEDMRPRCGAAHEHHGIDYRCDFPVGHDGDHADHFAFTQWPASPSPEEPARASREGDDGHIEGDLRESAEMWHTMAYPRQEATAYRAIRAIADLRSRLHVAELKIAQAREEQANLTDNWHGAIERAESAERAAAENFHKAYGETGKRMAAERALEDAKRDTEGTIRIRPSKTADTRSCDYASVTKQTLLDSSRQHIGDVRAGLAFFRQRITEAAERHDFDKITDIDSFHADFITGFAHTAWWDRHRKLNRHHLLAADGVPDDVNLIDVLDMIADCVMAGMARTGTVYPLDVGNEVLTAAFRNTVTLLQRNVTVVSDEEEDEPAIHAARLSPPATENTDG